ncbi:MAG: hypothetical protein FE78DRAFT_146242, partial [Acidomyces sp. 'richmondensis']
DRKELQKYLSRSEENAIVKFLLLMSDLGQRVRIMYIPSLAHTVTGHRPIAARPLKPRGKNRARFFEKRHPILKSRRAGALDWNRRPKKIYGQIQTDSRR